MIPILKLEQNSDQRAGLPSRSLEVLTNKQSDCTHEQYVKILLSESQVQTSDPILAIATSPARKRSYKAPGDSNLSCVVLLLFRCHLVPPLRSYIPNWNVGPLSGQFNNYPSCEHRISLPEYELALSTSWNYEPSMWAARSKSE